MKDIPNAAWALAFVFLACVLATVALYASSSKDTMAVITLASSIATGAFGYIQGHKDAQNQNPPPPANPAESSKP